MKSFYDFAVRTALENSNWVDSSNTEVPERFKMITESVITNLENKMEYLDKIHVIWIEKVFETIDVPEFLDEKMNSGELPDGEVPDSIINRLSAGLYHNDYNTLERDEQSIIKVLALYIIVQNLT